MFLRATLVIVASLNLAAAAWWALGPPPRLPAPAAASAASLRLLAEATPTAAQAVAPAVCLRFGPFAGPAARTGAQLALAAHGVQSALFEDRSGAASGWDVYLPAQASRAEATALAERLKAAGVDDVFVLSEGRNANRIALGRFSSEAGARRRAGALRAQGVEPAIEARGNGKPRIWLDARLPAGVDPSQLTEIAPAQAQDCAAVPPV